MTRAFGHTLQAAKPNLLNPARRNPQGLLLTIALVVKARVDLQTLTEAGTCQADYGAV